MNAANMARDHGVRTVDVRVSGPDRAASRPCVRWRRRESKSVRSRRDANSAQRLPSASGAEFKGRDAACASF